MELIEKIGIIFLILFQPFIYTIVTKKIVSSKIKFIPIYLKYFFILILLRAVVKVLLEYTDSFTINFTSLQPLLKVIFFIIFASLLIMIYIKNNKVDITFKSALSISFISYVINSIFGFIIVYFLAKL